MVSMTLISLISDPIGSDAPKDYYEKEPCVGGSRIVFESDSEKATFEIASSMSWG